MTNAAAIENPSFGVPPPPGLHWLIVLALSFVTLGIFFYVWMFVQAIWVRKVDRSSKTLLLYILGIAIIVAAAIVGEVKNGELVESLIRLSSAVPILTAHFRLAGSLEDYSKNAGGPWIGLSGVLVFFFGPIYLQYHMNQVRSFLREVALANPQ